MWASRRGYGIVLNIGRGAYDGEMTPTDTPIALQYVVIQWVNQLLNRMREDKIYFGSNRWNKTEIRARTDEKRK